LVAGSWQSAVRLLRLTRELRPADFLTMNLQELDTHLIEVRVFDNKGFPDFSYSSLRVAIFAARQSQSMVDFRIGFV
jgi:hypothetical protein